MRNVYTVKQVNAYIKNMFSQDFMMNRIYVKGEVSNCKYHSSGHIYFSLKDESGVIACVMFASQRKGLAFRMQEGQQVIVLGSITTYERDGKYQLYAKEMILSGAGLLYEKYETLKKELEEMGMFAPEYKQPIPFYANRIGIVTAPAGAAIRDIMNIAKRRNPYVQLLLYPALVQGEGAKASIVKGIHMLEKKQVDVIIVGRGGGSIEDLWAFNEEEVARAIFDCSVPVISAVGHETDTTIADYVADLRAPTPSAAAELSVADYNAVAGKMDEIHLALRRQMVSKAEHLRRQTDQYKIRLSYLHPRNKIRDQRQKALDLEEKLRSQMENSLYRAKQKMALRAEMLKGLSPLEKLSQGYSYVSKEAGKAVKSVDAVNLGEKIVIHVIDGTIHAEVQEVLRDQQKGN